MKKSKRPTGLEDDGKEFVKEPEIDLDQDYDDEVIDLEEVIELKEGVLEDEEDFDLDVEIIDIDSDIQADDLTTEFEADIDTGKERGLLADLSAGGMKGESPAKTEARAESGETQFVDPLFSLFTEKPTEPDIRLNKPQGDYFESMFQSDIQGSSIERKESGGSAQASLAGGPVAPPVEASPTVDERLEIFVSQIETKLVDAVREIVESKLPEIVQAVLKEEIERLKKEQGW